MPGVRGEALSFRAPGDISGTSMQAQGAPPQTSRARQWYPAPAIQATAALHVGGALALALPSTDWRWVVGALLANHGLIFAATLAPRSQVLGPNVVRLPAASAARREVALTFDDGPDPEVTPRVLDILERHGAVGNFFCIGERAAAHPALMREIVARGHAVESHSHVHSLAFACFGPRRLRREVRTAQEAIHDAAGVAPVFFRAPYGPRSPMLDLVLAREGLTYVSWKWRGYDSVDSDPERVFRRLADPLRAGDVLLLHDGSTAARRRFEPTVLRALPRLLRHLREQGLAPVTLRSAFGVAQAA
jgi:peptidoglycan/xylan/chitin deacetylase (PgdA/CDA1 family)